MIWHHRQALQPLPPRIRAGRDFAWPGAENPLCPCHRPGGAELLHTHPRSDPGENPSSALPPRSGACAAAFGGPCDGDRFCIAAAGARESGPASCRFPCLFRICQVSRALVQKRRIKVMMSSADLRRRKGFGPSLTMSMKSRTPVPLGRWIRAVPRRSCLR